MSPTKSSSHTGNPYSTHAPQKDITKSALDLQLVVNPNFRVDGSLSVSNASLNPDNSEHEASFQSLRQIPSKISGSSNVASSTALQSKRMGTLSWQQWHPSRGITKARSHTLSADPTDNGATQGTNTDNLLLVEEPLSRNQIGQSLLLKDPTLFRQTEDRGIGSAGYRRNKDEDGLETTISNGKTRFPGLSRDTSLEPENRSDPASEPICSTSPLMDSSVQNESSGINRYSSLTSRSSGGIALSPLPILSSQVLQPMLSDSSSHLGEERSAITRSPAMSPSQGRISPERLERPHSPTKGLGGFVQSAMLKRSDSVNKRWSTQAATGISRGNSVVYSRNGNETSRQAISGPGTSRKFKPTSPRHENSPLPTPGTGSSNNASTVTIPLSLPRTEKNASNTSSLLTSYNIQPNFGNETVKSSLPPFKATPSLIEYQDRSSAELASKPASPSKRWSPTKASWLEKALNKPESPKPRIVPPQQPSWMMDITKAKQQRGSVDLGRSVATKEVMDRSLARSPSPGIQSRPQSVEAPQRALISRVATKNGGPILNETDSTRIVEQLVAVENIVQDGPSDEDARAMNHTAEIKNPAELGGSPSPPISFQLSTTEGGIPSSERGSIPSPKPESPPPSKTSIEGLQARNRLVSTSDTKPKPKTPPKKDFRSVLKTRPISDGRQNREEAEFKNVFGKLKRTETQNYVAPDELKENILRGKAGLAATGGPKKTERRDELRESILRQREAMKTGAPPGIPKKPRGISVLPDRDSPPPEAITKRLGLTKAENGSINASTNTQDEVERVSTATPGGRAEFLPLRVKLKPTAPEKQQATNNTQIGLPANSKPGDQFSSSLAGLLKRGPSSLAKADGSRTNLLVGNTILADSTDGHSTSGHSLTHITKSRSKGPKRRLPQSAKFDARKTEITSNTNRNEEPGAPEMTQSPAPEETLPSFIASNALETQLLRGISNTNQRLSQLPSQRRLSAETSLVKKLKHSPPKAKSEVKESRSANSRTPTPVKQMSTSSPKSEQIIIQPISESANWKLLSPATDLLQRAPITTGEKGQPLESPEKGISPKRAKREAFELKKSPSPSLNLATSARSPVIFPSRENDKISLGDKGLNFLEGQIEPVGLGIQTGIRDSTVEAPPDSSLPSTPIGSLSSKKLPRSPPLPGRKPGSIVNRVPSIAGPIQERKPAPLCQFRERSRILASFFEESSSLKPKITVDTQAVLASRPKDDCQDKIKTLRKQIYLMTGGGKLMPVPSHQEHILFEENLYLCTHVFATAGGSRTAEVYLWIGDGVAEPAAEDAHLFARKVAREQNGKLITLQQGNETSNFFQALGGIVITRRGSGSRAESPSRTLATYMLCGRSHAGQIAFDEVDFDARSLCSGFPFLISARFGKLYLWKGLGSGADELGCARLIGMDLGLTGEIEEVDEGSEPDTFWESLPGGKPRCITAEDGMPHHWHLKPSCDKYSSRLFSVNVEPTRPKSSSSSFIWGRRGSTPQLESTDFTAQIRELSPFTQRDIEKDGVYVLDSFFEIFL